MSDSPAQTASAYELPGIFYLGRGYDLQARQLRQGPEHLVLYPSKRLTTHALCVGMTGSGKTGLCIDLLEEAAIDGVPMICVDPKGDLGNLLLTFPELRPDDFAPWIDHGEAAQRGKSVELVAAEHAAAWREGLEAWEQSPDRIARFARSIDRTIYTPGSSIGMPLTVLKSFNGPAPSEEMTAEESRDWLSTAASGLLSLLRIDADPLTSREHILVSKILQHAWVTGSGCTLPDLIRYIQSPPIDRVGVLDLESFYPAKDRAELAMRLNNLLASPAFVGWLEGEPLDVQRLLYTADGRPRCSILSLAHLDDSERMFFLTILLNEVVAWMRSQSGTGSLRAILYVDEIFGFFPPTANPPTKLPMLTLLKQARAFGLGVVLATQNPVDLDYKGLANIGTWFLGRLQTDRDKQRVLDGLEGAATGAGNPFDRAAMERTLASLGSRVFLLNDVRESQPTIFQTRWALSYLRGPLSRQQISSLMQAKREASGSEIAAVPPAAAGPRVQLRSSAMETTEGNQPPILPPDVRQLYWRQSKLAAASADLLYRPAIFAPALVHFVKASAGVDGWLDVAALALCDERRSDPWDGAAFLSASAVDSSDEPEPGFDFETPPAELANAKTRAAWQRSLKDRLYRDFKATVYRCEPLKRWGRLGQSESETRIELRQQARETRDAAVEELEQRYRGKLDTLRRRVEDARRSVDREQGEAQGHLFDSITSIGSSVLGTLLSSRRVSATSLNRIGSAARKATRAKSSRSDAALAQQRFEALEADYRELQERCERELAAVKERFAIESLPLEPVELPCRKGDMQLGEIALLWVPFESRSGEARPLVDLP